METAGTARVEEKIEEGSHDRMMARVAAWIVPIIIYAAIAIPLGIIQRERINPDGISYIQRARLLSRGEFYYSLSDHWSPMLSWCIAPFIGAGVDGLYAARVVTCAWGALMLISFHLFLKRFADLPALWRMGVLAAVSIAIAPIAVRQITPDVLLAAWLMLYFAIVCHRGFERSRVMQFGAGVVGGGACLAKAYALPFILAHVVFMLLWRGARTKASERAWVRLSGGSGLILGGLMLIVLPWTGIMTWRYGHLTFSGAGVRAHAQVGPAGGREMAPAYFGVPPGPYLIRGEAQETILYPSWSPVESAANFRHQLEVMREHAGAIGREIWSMDALHLLAVAAVVGLVAVAFRTMRWEAVWILGSIIIYCSGFLFVFFTPRYIAPVVMPLLMVLAVTLCREWERVARGWVRGIAVLLEIAVLVSCAWAGAVEATELWRTPATPLYRMVGEKIRELKLSGPMATANISAAQNVAYHAQMKLLGFPPEADAQVAARRLNEHGAGVLLIWSGTRQDRRSAAQARVAEEVAHGKGWLRVFEVKWGREMAEVYARAER